MPHDDDANQPRSAALTRARLVTAALELVQQDGLQALTMRALADRLQIKAASLYWHVRDRDELLELVAAALLAEVRWTGRRAGWRTDAVAICTALERVLARRRDSARVLLSVPGVLERGQAHAALRGLLSAAGLPGPQAFETAMMMLSWVLIRSLEPSEERPLEAGRPVLVSIDTGSRGVTLRAGAAMSGLIRAAHDPAAAAPAVIRGDQVIVRRLRGVRQGELELNPAHPWRFKVQAPTWNTVLNLAGLDVRGIHIDSGAARIDCILPPPRGMVPIEISSGVVGVRLRRPPGVAMVAEVSTGVVQLRLDRRSIGATTTDVYWECGEGAAAGDYYRLKIYSGTLRVSVEEDASISPTAAPGSAPEARAGIGAALEVVLDGVAARIGRPTSTA